MSQCVVKLSMVRENESLSGMSKLLAVSQCGFRPGKAAPAWSLPGPLPPADQPAPPLRLFLRTTKPKRGVTAAHSARSACRVAWYVRIIQAVRTAVSAPADGMNRKIRHCSTRHAGTCGDDTTDSTHTCPATGDLRSPTGHSHRVLATNRPLRCTCGFLMQR
ncbi:hypothetical protein Bbelb_013190 [Branchiostoma belcheri]|nr:hypothetical protein Bbelb_013190 [Branchiostoma belcheri]